MPEQSKPASVTANGKGKYEFDNVSASFAKELVSDLSGLGEAFDKGEVNAFSFLEFCVAHLTKIDRYIATTTGGPTA